MTAPGVRGWRPGRPGVAVTGAGHPWGDDDRARDGGDGLVEGLQSALDGAARAGDLVLIGDDCVRGALTSGGDQCSRWWRTTATRLWSSPGQLPQRVADRRTGSASGCTTGRADYARTLTGGQDDDGGGRDMFLRG